MKVVPLREERMELLAARAVENRLQRAPAIRQLHVRVRLRRKQGHYTIVRLRPALSIHALERLAERRRLEPCARNSLTLYQSAAALWQVDLLLIRRRVLPTRHTDMIRVRSDRKQSDNQVLLLNHLFTHLH